MKKLIAIILAVLMLLGLTACLKNDKNNDKLPDDGTAIISPEKDPEKDGSKEEITQEADAEQPSVDDSSDDSKEESDKETSSSSSSENNRPSKPDKPEVDKPESDEPKDEEDNDEEIYVSDEIYFEEYFTPVVRFAVASDVHFDDAGSEKQEARLKEMFDVAYEYSSSQDYPSLDGAFIVGDYTNRGTEISMQKFFDAINQYTLEGTTSHVCLGNHEYGAGEATKERYLRISGYEDIHEHIVINGYHFILLSPDRNSGYNFSEDAIMWLSEQLEIAAKDDESRERPIFVFQHEHIKGTVHGSDDWGVAELTDILSKYPQVIDFSGHSHYPMNDPRIIWQGDFTALGTSTLSYFEMDLVGVRSYGIFHTDYEGGYAYSARIFDAAQFYIVEVDKNNAVKIMGYDLTYDKFIDDAVFCLRSVQSTEEFKYTAERKLASEVPYFKEDTLFYAENISYSSAKLRFGQAVCEDNVQNYIVNLYKDDELISSQRRLSCTFAYPVPEELSVTFDNLQVGGNYKAEVIAVSSWEKMSEPIMFEFTVKPNVDIEFDFGELSSTENTSENEIRE
ncbi:MAG: metallophosphoesterase [Eubacteriaceae bacterium]|nr:metallophosphoesterase [Eubacteriaceae bacterium]